MLGWKTVTIAHEIECYFSFFFFFKICKVQSSVFLHIVHICICFTEQLNNNKYDVNGGYSIFHISFDDFFSKSFFPEV